MVVFTCNHCGESLQKPKVEKHYSFVCRRNKFLTCVDCLKDFSGQEYNSHIKCITEEERYAAKGTYKNGIVKKGEVKQEQWSDMIRSILNDSGNLKPNVRNLLNHIVNFTNVPRKKPKFMNFIRNTMGGRINVGVVEEVWNVIEEYKKKVSSVPENTKPIKEITDPNKQNGDLKRKNVDLEEVKRKKVKTENSSEEKQQIESAENGNSEDNNTKKFQMKEEILKILTKKGSLSVTKLQKKIFKKYKACDEEIDSQKFSKWFNKKLKKISEVVIENDMVSIESK